MKRRFDPVIALVIATVFLGVMALAVILNTFFWVPV